MLQQHVVHGVADCSLAVTSLSISFRETLVSPSGQVIQSAIAAEMAITVMASGTIPFDLEPVPESFELPALPTTCIQIVERDQGLSRAALQVKELVRNAY